MFYQGRDKVDTHTHPFNSPLSGTTRVSRYQEGKINVDFTEARDSEWQWHQLGHMQVCTLLQTDNHASTTPLSFFQAGCPSCHPTNKGPLNVCCCCMYVNTTVTESHGASCARMNLRQLPKSRPQMRTLLSPDPVAMTATSDDMSRHVTGRL